MNHNPIISCKEKKKRKQWKRDWIIICFSEIIKRKLSFGLDINIWEDTSMFFPYDFKDGKKNSLKKKNQIAEFSKSFFSLWSLGSTRLKIWWSCNFTWIYQTPISYLKVIAQYNINSILVSSFYVCFF